MLYFDDLEIGRKFDCGPYPVTKDEIVEFAQEFDPQPHHLDEEAAKASLLGGLAASGWHTCAMTMRMFADGVIPLLDAQGGLGSPEGRWMKPVRPGDVLTVESEVKEKVDGRRPDRGTVKIESRIQNQRGEVVMSLVSLVIYLRR